MATLKDHIGASRTCYSTKHILSKQHACTCECMPYLYLSHCITAHMAFMNEHMNACLWHQNKIKGKP